MKTKPPSQLLGYALAVGSTALATWLHLLAKPYLGDSVPYITFFPAVFITAIFARVGPTLLAVALSGISALQWFVPPDHALLPQEGAVWAGIMLFLLFGSGIAVLAERMHRESSQVRWERERFLVTLSSIADGVIVTDERARVTFLNEVAQQLTGWSLADAQGQPLDRIFRTEDEQTRQPLESSVIAALRQQHPVSTSDIAILISKDGSEHAISETAAPIRQRKRAVVGAVLVFRNVSEQRSAQMVAGRLAALVDSSEDAILGQTFEGIVTDWNRGAEQLFGFEAEEIIGTSVLTTIVPPTQKQQLLEVLRRVRDGEPGEQFETERQSKDGRIVPVSVRISPIHDANGAVIGASAIDRDISDRRAAEQRRNARHAVSQILADETNVEDAARQILAAVASALKWNWGCYWQYLPDEDALRCLQTWYQPGEGLELFRDASVQQTFGRGNSLPGRVWESGQGIWIADVSEDAHFVRAAEAKQAGLHGGFAYPISIGDEFLGVVEWFSKEVQQPDDALLETMATIGGQIGQFIDRCRAARKLWRSEQELSDFFENAAVGLHWVGPDGIVLRVNQSELDLLGYERSEVIGRHIAEFHVDQPVIEDILSRLLQGQQVRDCEARLRCKDGSIKQVLIDSNVFYEEGEFIHTRCFTRDNTERKQAEASLHESEERLRLALEAGRMGTWQWQIASGEVIWSPTLEKVHGLEPGTFDGTLEAYKQDIHPEDLAGVLEAIRHTVEEGSEHHLEYRIVWPDGSVHWLESRGELSVDDSGQPVRVTGVCSDITERKQLEQQLQRQLGQLADAATRTHFLAEASKSLSSLVDYRSTLQKVASLAVPAFADWIAVDMLDTEGAIQRVAVAHVDPAKINLAEELYRRVPPGPDASRGVMNVLRTGQPVMAKEVSDAVLQEIAENEEHLQLLRELNISSYICVPLRAKEGILGVLSFVSAESAKRFSDDDLTMAEDLAHRAAIAIENAKLYQEVRDADLRKDEFLAMLAHELRNPLVPIRSGLDILGMESGDHQEIIELMQGQVEHIVRLVDDLLDVSRIMRGKVELRKEPIRLATVITRSVETVRSLIENRQQQLVVEVVDEPVWLSADPVRLAQIFENLLSNASKYMDDGGRIDLKGQVCDGQAVITVRDAGFGIEPELLPKVFELFTQASRSLDRTQGGLGIGLTLVQRLVQLHDGTVTASSEGLGRGSEFVVKLPVAAAPSTDDVVRKPVLSVLPRRILVVDDNRGSAWLLKKLLLKLGDHQVETAHDGPAALQQIKAFQPEVVLLDIGLPGMDGYQVGATVRDDPSYDDLLLVALTGYGQAEDRRKTKDVGFDEHLVKPPSVDQMRTVLSHPKLAMAPQK